jgi:hypothetical protein
VLQELIQAWATPAGLLLLLGGITWGVQLNVSIMNLTNKVSNLAGKTDKMSTELMESTRNNLRVSMLLTQLEKDAEKALRHAEEHEKDSAEWRQRIVALEVRNRDKGGS